MDNALLSLDALYGGTLADKITLARQLFARMGAEFLGREQNRADLFLMTDLQKGLAAVMVGMEMGSLCVACSARPGGGCCSSFMSGENDTVQLFLNLCAGVIPAIQRDDDVECGLLGPQGCILLFKPMFCLNYNCLHIHQGNSPEAMTRLERAAGDLLRQQYRSEQAVLAFFREKGILL